MLSPCIRGANARSWRAFSGAPAGPRPLGASAPQRGTLLVQAAGGKRAKGDKKPAQKKGGSALADLLKKKEAATGAADDGLATPDQYKDPDVLILLLAICTSYWKATGKFLMEDVDFETLGDAMYKAPFVCLAHNKFQPGVTDPEFIYANRAALQLWEGKWEEIVGLPSRKSAAEDPAVQQDRNALLEGAAEQGAITNYSGWRVSLRGKKFLIRNAILFNLVEASETPWAERGRGRIGQAVVFDEYELEDGTVVKVQGEAPPKVELPPPPPTEADIAAAEAAVEEQAALVRSLKEAQGKTNTDPEVQAAVAELKARKDRVPELRRLFEEANKEVDYDALEDEDDDSDK